MTREGFCLTPCCVTGSGNFIGSVPGSVPRFYSLNTTKGPNFGHMTYRFLRSAICHDIVLNSDDNWVGRMLASSEPWSVTKNLLASDGPVRVSCNQVNTPVSSDPTDLSTTTSLNYNPANGKYYRTRLTIGNHFCNEITSIEPLVDGSTDFWFMAATMFEQDGTSPEIGELGTIISTTWLGDSFFGPDGTFYIIGLEGRVTATPINPTNWNPTGRVRINHIPDIEASASNRPVISTVVTVDLANLLGRSPNLSVRGAINPDDASEIILLEGNLGSFAGPWSMGIFDINTGEATHGPFEKDQPGAQLGVVVYGECVENSPDPPMPIFPGIRLAFTPNPPSA